MAQSVAIGLNSGYNSQGDNSVAVGAGAGYSFQGSFAVAIGALAGSDSQKINSVAIGNSAGYQFQNIKSVAIGYQAGYQSQNESSVAIGDNAGYTNQNINAVAIGTWAGKFSQDVNCVSIGNNAGNYLQKQNSIAIGASAGQYDQQQRSVAIGTAAGYNFQKNYSVAIGNNAGFTNQLAYSIAIGSSSGYDTQGENCVAVGANSGNYGQKSFSVAIGNESGNYLQSQGAVANGYQAGNTNQGQYSVAIGYQTGYTNQGANSIAIGQYAGYGSQAPNSIVFNASNSILNGSTSGCFINPIALNNGNTTNYISYNTSSKELTYNNESIFLSSSQNDAKIFTAQADSNATNPGQVTIYSKSNTNKRLDIGFNTTLNYGSIQSVFEGTGYRPLLLNPMDSMVNQGTVGVNHTIATLNSGFNFSVKGTATKTDGSTAWSSPSDRRIKLDISEADLDLCYSVIKSLPLRRFTWNPKYCQNMSDKKVLGWIADEVESCFPKSITTNNQSFVVDDSDKSNLITETLENFKTVDVDQITKVMYGTIQKLIIDVETLQLKCENLQNQINSSSNP